MEMVRSLLRSLSSLNQEDGCGKSPKERSPLCLIVRMTHHILKGGGTFTITFTILFDGYSNCFSLPLRPETDDWSEGSKYNLEDRWRTVNQSVKNM